MRTVFVFGNPDLAMDAMPLLILPRLRERFPDAEFVVKDPNEEWDLPEEFIVLDTVVDLASPAVFEDLKAFAASPRVTVHDFDALSNLRLLDKLGKLGVVRIVGLPPDMDEDTAFAAASEALEGLLDAS